MDCHKTEKTQERQEMPESNTDISYTQVACCAVGTNHVEERRRQGLRARLERERFERERQREKSIVNTFRRLFRPGKA